MLFFVAENKRTCVRKSDRERERKIVSVFVDTCER